MTGLSFTPAIICPKKRYICDSGCVTCDFDRPDNIMSRSSNTESPCRGPFFFPSSFNLFVSTSFASLFRHFRSLSYSSSSQSRRSWKYNVFPAKRISAWRATTLQNGGQPEPSTVPSLFFFSFCLFLFLVLFVFPFRNCCSVGTCVLYFRMIY